MTDPTVRLRLDLGYDGTDFSGWARQPGRRTVQGVVESALGTITRIPAALTVAGRTDAGVHAQGQVAHVDLPAGVDRDTLLRSLRGLLPADVRVHRLSAAPPGFDARFSALWRQYAYRIADGMAGTDPLRRRFVTSWRHPLDVAAMAQAATVLVGEHDFAAFCRRRVGASTVRSVLALDVMREDDEVVVTVTADAFCHAMVRSIVGALAAVGEDRRPVGWLATLLDRDARADDVAVAPPHGLTLLAVGYPPPSQLASRAVMTRALRRLSRGAPRDDPATGAAAGSE